VDPVAIRKGDWLTIQNLRNFRLSELDFTKGDPGLRLRMEGVAGGIWSGSPGKPADRRLDRFDLLWRNQKLAALVAIVAAAGSAMIGLWKFLLEAKIIK
jgi:hypothetical protein